MYRGTLLGDVSRDILEYTSSLKEDKKLTTEVIEVLIAHTEHLMEQRLIPRDAGEKILSELNKMLKKPESLFSLPVEDIHEAIELHLHRRLGDIAGYIALGKSRNDHIAAALRLKIKKITLKELQLLVKLRSVLIERAKEYSDALMPAFTHLQPAQPTTFAHYLCHIEEIMGDYTHMLMTLLEIVDKSPLGAAAIGGTRVPLRREKMGRGLFRGEVVNTMAAVSSRDFMSLAAGVNASLSIALSRIAEDMVIFSTPQFGYVKPADEHLATSSMMPQKRNAATMEIARAWGGECMGHMVAVLGILKSLPTGYNLDMQQANTHILKLMEGTTHTLQIFLSFFSTLKVSKETMERDANIYPILASDLAEMVALKTSRPYRSIYREIAEIIRDAQSTEEIYERIEKTYGVSLSLREGLEKDVLGSPSPEKMEAYIHFAKERIEMDAARARSMGVDL